MNACYSESDALEQVGAEVVSAAELPDVPAGTKGRVIEARASEGRGWTLRIEWDLPHKCSAVFAQLGEFSFNVPWPAKRRISEFSKCEVEQLLRPVDSR